MYTLMKTRSFGAVRPSAPIAAVAVIVSAISMLASSAASLDIEKEGFVASGWMGDGKQGTAQIKVDARSTDRPHSGPTCYRWSYTPGSEGWAAVAWQYPENNWGDKAGKNYSKKGITKVSFFARGANGGEEVEFFSGGNTSGSFKASYEKVSETFTLTREWRPYSLSLDGKDTSMVVCAFGWAARGGDGPVTFFLDDIVFETSGAASAGASATVQERPAATSTASKAKPVEDLKFVASGWMGAAANANKPVTIDKECKERPHSGATCQKWTYLGGNPGWAAVAWQYPENNWGSKPGLKLQPFTKLTFAARSDRDGEEVEFFVGGNTEQSSQTSLPKVGDKFTLTREWQTFTLRLTGKDLSNVVCGFGWASNHPVTFYLDDLQFATE